LQQDIIKIKGKKIFINPFFYLKKLDGQTQDWFIEPGQISKSIIALNRNKIYPEIDWEILSFNEKLLKDATIELFLKTIQIIKTFHPALDSEELIEVEQKVSFYKKITFEKLSKKHLRKKEKLLLKEKKKLERLDFILNWQNWLSLKETKKMIIPVFVIILISTLTGWFAGVSKNSCNPYFESTNMNQL